MSVDIERIVESDLGVLADRAAWTAGSIDAVIAGMRRRRRRRRIARSATGVIVLAIVVGVTSLRSEHGDQAAAPSATPGVAPQGRQVTFTNAKSTLVPQVFAEPGSVLDFDIDTDHRIHFETNATVTNGLLNRSVCIVPDEIDSCSGLNGPANALTASTWPVVAPLGGADHVVYWNMIPSSTAFVQYRDSSTAQWAIPLDGVVAFPVKDWHNIVSISAFDDNGHQVATANVSTLRDAGGFSGSGSNGDMVQHEFFSSSPQFGRDLASELVWNSLSPEQQNAQTALAQHSMATCVGTSTSAAHWNQCFASTNTILTSALEQVTADNDANSPLIAHPAPPIDTITTTGDPFKLDDHLGRWIVIEFSSITCQQCTRIRPALQAFEQKQTLAADGALLFTVASGDDATDARVFYNDTQHVTWPVLIDRDAQIARTYRVDGFPVIWIIDPTGNIAYRTTSNTTVNQLTTVLTELKTAN